MKFWKYQGTGNDFVMIDQRHRQWIDHKDKKTIAHLCDRRFGIGADGVILLQNHPDFDFEMVFFNPDGSQSMCGNGGRCTVAFAHQLGIIQDHCFFLAIDGPHEAKITGGKKGNLWVELKMKHVEQVERQGNTFVINTGSPHYVRFENSLDGLDVVAEGRAVRYNERFKKEGINVNLAAPSLNGIEMLTYERGVEDETLSCGTGVTAAALAFHVFSGNNEPQAEISVSTKGGQLSVRFEQKGKESFENIWLCGPATKVFSGNVPVIG